VKTTIDLNDALFQETKRAAAKRGTTMRAMIEQGLRWVLDQEAPKPFVWKPVPFKGEGLQPGQREGDWAQVQELMYPLPGEDAE
jgi:hypothetical protein